VDGFWATKSEGVGLVIRAGSFQDFQPMWSWSTNVTDRQTDGRHAISIPRYALVHRAVKREGKVLKVTSRLYFSNMGSRHRWPDFHKNWQGCRSPWRNHSLQVWLQYFEIYGGSKFPFSHWLCWSSLRQCCRYRAACDPHQAQGKLFEIWGTMIAFNVW